VGKMIITYDLVKPDTDYPDLIKAIKAYPDCLYLMRSTWFIKTDVSFEEVRNFLRTKIDTNDRLLVADLSAAAWVKLFCSDDELKSKFR
jgi:hypothetical protein